MSKFDDLVRKFDMKIALKMVGFVPPVGETPDRDESDPMSRPYFDKETLPSEKHLDDYIDINPNYLTKDDNPRMEKYPRDDFKNRLDFNPKNISQVKEELPKFKDGFSSDEIERIINKAYDSYKLGEFAKNTGFNEIPVERTRSFDDRKITAGFGGGKSFLGTDMVDYNLNALCFDSTQDTRIEEIALGIVNNPVFIQMEAKFYNNTIYDSHNTSSQLGARYTLYMVDEIANVMSNFSLGITMRSVLEYGSKTKPVDAINAVKEQIDKVNYCPAQIKGIIQTGKVKDAYVDNVAARVELLNSRNLRY